MALTTKTLAESFDSISGGYLPEGRLDGREIDAEDFGAGELWCGGQLCCSTQGLCACVLYTFGHVNTPDSSTAPKVQNPLRVSNRSQI
jgi:hypothetical protein